MSTLSVGEASVSINGQKLEGYGAGVDIEIEELMSPELKAAYVKRGLKAQKVNESRGYWLEACLSAQNKHDELLKKLKRIAAVLLLEECHCGGEEPDGSSPTCHRCLALEIAREPGKTS